MKIAWFARFVSLCLVACSPARDALPEAGADATMDEAAVDASDASDASVPAPPRLTVSGSQLLDPTSQPIILRGFNWGQFQTAQIGDATDNAALGANVVRIPLSWYFGDSQTIGGPQDSYLEAAPGHIDPTLLAAFDQQITWATTQHLWVDIMVRGGDLDFWTNAAIIPEFIEMWQFLANRYRNTPYVAAYELLSEPHPPTKQGFGNGDVKKLYEQLIAAIHSIDPRTPLMIGAATDYEIRDLEQVYLSDETNVIYTANFYELPAYVKQAKSDDGGVWMGYPSSYVDQARPTDSCDSSNAGQPVTMDKTFLAGLVGCMIAFRDAHHVPVFVDQVGLRTITPDSASYAADVLDILHTNGVGFAYWTYRSSYSANSPVPPDGDVGVLYQTADLQWHQKAPWLTLLGTFLQGSTTE